MHLRICVDEKAEVGNRPGLVTTTSQPSVYLSTHAVKGTWPTVESLTRSQSITNAIEERTFQDPEFVKRRATTIDMPTQHHGKKTTRRRLFVSFFLPSFVPSRASRGTKTVSKVWQYHIEICGIIFQ